MNIRTFNQRYMQSLPLEVVRVKPDIRGTAVDARLLRDYLRAVRGGQLIIFDEYYWPTARNCYGHRLVLVKFEKDQYVFTSDAFLDKMMLISLSGEQEIRTVVDLQLRTNVTNLLIHFKEKPDVGYL